MSPTTTRSPVTIIARDGQRGAFLMARNTMEAWLREEQDSQVIRRLNQTSAAETRFRAIPMNGNVKTEPRMVDMGVGVVAKGAAYTEDEGANDEVTLTARKFAKALRVAEEDIDDNIADVLTAKKEGWVTSFGIMLDNACLGVSAAENGTTIPFTSVYRALGQNNAATGYTANAHKLATAGVLTYDDLSDLASLVEGGTYFDGSRSAFMAHPRVKGLVRKIKDADGNPIFTPSPRVGDPDTLFGYPIVWTNGAVTTATASAGQAVTIAGGAAGAAGNALIVFGNVDFFLLGKRSGPESVVIDGRDGTAALTDETLLKVRARRAFVLAHEFAAAVLEITEAP